MNADKKQLCFELSQDLYQDLNQIILDKYGQIYGHIKYSVQEAIKTWVEQQKLLLEEAHSNVKR